jgi:hypothetical protein
MRPRPGQVPQDVVRFYFMQEGDAAAFLGCWGGELSEK